MRRRRTNRGCGVRDLARRRALPDDKQDWSSAPAADQVSVDPLVRVVT